MYAPGPLRRPTRDDVVVPHELDTSSPLDLTPLEGPAVVSGAPATGFRALTAVAGVEVGIWEMTPGTATDVEADEVFVVLSGSGTVDFSDGSSLELRPGSTVRLHAGDQTRWTIRETLRKVYMT